jgi:AcrR family transcriptional regulator
VIYASLIVILISLSRGVVKKLMSRRAGAQTATDRPRRGSPEETRERLIRAAGSQFNRFGYHGTDSNTIAKEAGYATGTFYKHFRDKREVFLAAYERWLAAEWKEVDDELSRMRNAEETAKRLVEVTIRFHTEWRGLRASLMELVFSDPEVRRFFRKQRRRQLDHIVELRSRFTLPPQTSEQDAIFMCLTERVYDAIGQGEIQSLGLDQAAVIESMVEKTHAFLE